MPYIRDYRFPFAYPVHTSGNDVDVHGRDAFNTSFGDRIVTGRIDDISIQFKFNLATEPLTSTVTGTGTTTSADAMATLQSGATASSTAKLNSKNLIRYRSGHDGFAYFTTIWPNPPTNANGYARIGPFDSLNGFWWGYKGTTFGVGRRYEGVDIFTPMSSFNVDKLDGTGPHNFKILPDNVNLFGISWGWLGIAPIFYYVFAGLKRGWVLAHVDDLGNKSTTLSTFDPVQPITAEVANSAAAANVKMRTGSWNGGTTGWFESDSWTARYFQTQNTKTIGATKTSLFGLQNPTTIFSRPNKVIWELVSIGVAIDNGTSGIIQLHKNPTVTSASYGTAIDAVNSTGLLDTAGTTFTATGSIQFMGGAAGNSGAHWDLTNERILLYPGETLHASENSGSSTTQNVTVSVRWREYW